MLWERFSWAATTIGGHQIYEHIEGILPKGPYLPCVSMAGRALLAGYHRYEVGYGGAAVSLPGFAIS